MSVIQSVQDNGGETREGVCVSVIHARQDNGEEGNKGGKIKL